jgi:hypothetical protein
MVVSVDPPGAKPTRKLISLSGNSPAQTVKDHTTKPNSANGRDHLRIMRFPPFPG